MEGRYEIKYDLAKCLWFLIVKETQQPIAKADAGSFKTLMQWWGNLLIAEGSR